ALPRAVAVSLPSVLVMGLVLGYTVNRWERHLPALDQLAPPICLFPLGKARWPILAMLLFVLGALATVPILSLLWKAGLGGSPEEWSGVRTGQRLLQEWSGKRSLIVENLILDVSTGIATAGLALTTCWLATESRWFRTLMFILAAAAWALPGPIIGIGLKQTIL